MKNVLIASIVMIAVAAATSTALIAGEERCVGDCRYHPVLRNQWGYGGLVQTWGLGGIANAPWMGGAVVGVMPYGPHPYDHVKHLNGL